MLFTGGRDRSLLCFRHASVPHGGYSNYAGHEFSGGESFLWSAFWLVITGFRFAAYTGGFTGCKNGPSE